MNKVLVSLILELGRFRQIMTRKVITTVGTSLFTNYQNRDKVIRTYPELSKDYEAIDVQFNNLSERFDPSDLKKRINISASERANSRFESDIEYIKERIEYLLFDLVRDARTVVANANFDGFPEIFCASD